MVGMFRSLAVPLLASALCTLPVLADPSPAFLVKDIDAIFQMRFEAKHGPLGVLVDLFDISLSKEKFGVQIPENRGTADFVSEIGMTIADFAVTYDPSGEPIGVARCPQRARAAGNGAERRDVGHHGNHARRHRFDQRVAAAFGTAAADEDIRGGVVVRQFFTRDASRQRDAIRENLRPAHAGVDRLDG